MDSQIEKIISDKSLYKVIDFDENSKILFVVETNTLFRISNNTAINLSQNNLCLEEKSEIERLCQNDFFTPFNEHTILKANPLEGENLAININLTSYCNLSCKYCFAQGGDYGEENKNIMKPDILNGLKDFIFKKVSNTNTVRIEFFGGEPLLNSKMIIDVYNLCEQIKDEAGINFIYRISTNLTTLSSEILNVFVKGKFIVSVSIDGNESTHNFNRPGKNGENYYEDIINNCKRIRNQSKNVLLVARLTIYNSETSLIENVDNLIKHNLFDYFQILPAFIPDTDISNNNINIWRNNSINYIVPDNVAADFDKFISKYETFFSNKNRFLGNLEFERIADLIINKKIVNSYCFAGRNYFTISSDFSIVPCHRFVGNEFFLLGYINKITKEPSEWQENYMSNEICKKCWGRYICGGGCKQQNYLRTGKINMPDAVFCMSELQIIEKVICSLHRQNQEYFKKDRTVLDKLFVSCGRPILKSDISLKHFETIGELKYFKLLSFN
jgi:uncharacterized protein